MPKSRKRKSRSSARRGSRRSERIFRSPLTGDLGFPDHPWIRVNDEWLGIPHPTVMFDVAELRANGYNPETLGMTLVKDHSSSFEVPEADVMADMKSRFDIDLYESDVADANNPVRIIGGVFGDPHPDDWWNRVHSGAELVLLAGDTPRIAEALDTAPNTPFDFFSILVESYIGRVKGLMIRAYPTGVGTAHPEA